MLERIATSRVTIRMGLTCALIAQVMLAVFLVAADVDLRWLQRLGSQDALPSGPASPGDQVRKYDPSRTSPDFTERTNLPGLELSVDMPMQLEFKTVDLEDFGQVLLLNGPVEPGDAKRFEAFIASLEAPPKIAALNSPGGVVDEALSIGRSLREIAAETVLLPGMTCLSSCPYILAAGVERRVSRKASVGLHQHYYEAPGYMPVFLAVEGIQYGQGQTLEYLVEMGIDAGLMIYSLNTPPEEIYLLVEDELLGTQLATEVVE